MKIALVAKNVSSMGGVPQYVLRLGLALSGQHDVTIFSTDFEGSESPPIGHKRVWSPDGDGLIQRVSFSLASSVRMILAGHENDEFDIINAHGDYSAFANVTTSHYCEAESVKRLAGVQTSNTLNLHLGGKGKAILEGIEERLAAKRPLIVVSEGMKREWLANYDVRAERIFVVPGGVDCETFSPANRLLFRTDVRDRHRLAAETKVILFLGGDWQRKGLAQTIRSLSRPGLSEAVLLVAGTGDVRRYAEMARLIGVRERVIFVGRCQEPWAYYAASDIFVLASSYETFGLTVLEAMASGLPVVVSRKAGVAELISDGGDGLLLENPKDTDEIAAKLALLLAKPELVKQLAARARQVAQAYSWADVAKRTLAVYEQVIGRGVAASALHA